ncbi:MAG: hypothetical protein IPN94_26505 [Sphingobacteriales bacterium]|nr:hypothetical protein [Sphingobacteriales bacterium]
MERQPRPHKIEFVNAIEKWGATQTTFYDSTDCAMVVNTIECVSRAILSSVWVPGSFPARRARLIYLASEHAEYPYDSLVYVPDTSGQRECFTRTNKKQQAAKRLTPQFQLPGWDNEAMRYSSQKNTYNTNLAIPCT